MARLKTTSVYRQQSTLGYRITDVIFMVPNSVVIAVLEIKRHQMALQYCLAVIIYIFM